jgi:hypothetical protein
MVESGVKDLASRVAFGNQSSNGLAIKCGLPNLSRTSQQQGAFGLPGCNPLGNLFASGTFPVRKVPERLTAPPRIELLKHGIKLCFGDLH